MATVQSALKPFEAAKDKQVSIVLIAGTGDDCVSDLCRAAEDLHRSYTSAKLTVLGIGMAERAASTFTCAAKAMGGTFTAIKSGGDLEKALKQSFGAAFNENQPANAARGTSQPIQGAASEKGEDKTVGPAKEAAQEKPAPPQPPQPEPNTILSAVSKPGEPPLDAGVSWAIFKITTTPTGQIRTAESPSWTGGGGQAKTKLAEGKYLARATYGLASAAMEFSVAGDKAEKTLSLEAGSISAEAVQTKDGQHAEESFFILYRGRAKQDEIGRSSENPAIFHVPAGDYILTASASGSKADAPVKVEAGQTAQLTIALNIGTLEIKTYAAEGSQKEASAWHWLYPSGGTVPILRIAGAFHRIQIPAGDYRLETVYGNARQESKIKVAAGAVTSQTIVLNAGEAKVNLSGKPEKVCSVFEAGGENKGAPIGRAAGAEISFILKAGLYDVECRDRGSAIPPRKAQVQVVPGEIATAKIE